MLYTVGKSALLDCHAVCPVTIADDVVINSSYRTPQLYRPTILLKWTPTTENVLIRPSVLVFLVL